MLVVVFDVVGPLMHGGAAPAWPLLAAAACGTVAVARPGLLAKPYAAWMTLAEGLAWVNTRIVLGLVFYLIVLPTGLFLRVRGRDPMRRRFEPEQETYRIPASAFHAKSMERPY